MKGCGKSNVTTMLMATAVNALRIGADEYPRLSPLSVCATDSMSRAHTITAPLPDAQARLTFLFFQKYLYFSLDRIRSHIITLVGA